MLASPVKRLGLQSWTSPWIETMPKLELPKPARSEREKTNSTKVLKAEKGKHPTRRDLAPRPTARNMSRLCRNRTVALAKSKALRDKVISNIEASSSKRKLPLRLVQVKFGVSVDPPSPENSCRSPEGSGLYKSAFSYLIELKTLHMKKDHAWSVLLDRHFKLWMAAAKSSVGHRGP